MKRRTAKRHAAQRKVENSRQQHVQHHTAKQAATLQNVETTAIESQHKLLEVESAQANENKRPKKFRTWIKANIFNALLTIFTAMSAFGFIFDAYITKRAYITRGNQDGKTFSILPENTGLEIFLRNTGQTPVKRHVIQAWLLKQGQVAPIDEVPQHIQKSNIASGSPICLYIQWPTASQDIPRIQKDQVGIGILGRIT
jgi:hypothetical protein